MRILKEAIGKIVPASEERMKKKAKELNSILKTPDGLGKM